MKLTEGRAKVRGSNEELRYMTCKKGERIPRKDNKAIKMTLGALFLCSRVAAESLMCAI